MAVLWDFTLFWTTWLSFGLNQTSDHTLYFCVFWTSDTWSWGYSRVLKRWSTNMQWQNAVSQEKEGQFRIYSCSILTFRRVEKWSGNSRCLCYRLMCSRLLQVVLVTATTRTGGVGGAETPRLRCWVVDESIVDNLTFSPRCLGSFSCHLQSCTLAASEVISKCDWW